MLIDFALSMPKSKRKGNDLIGNLLKRKSTRDQLTTPGRHDIISAPDAPVGRKHREK